VRASAKELTGKVRLLHNGPYCRLGPYSAFSRLLRRPDDRTGPVSSFCDLLLAKSGSSGTFGVNVRLQHVSAQSSAYDRGWG
jgi:hypothetical protein